MKLALFVVLVAGGCSKPPPARHHEPLPEEMIAPPATAPSASWNPGVVGGQYRLSVEGEPTYLATLSTNEDGVGVSFVGSWPPDTTASLGDQTVNSLTLGNLRFPMYEAVGDAPVFRLDVETDPAGHAPDVTVRPEQPLIVHFNNGVDLSIPLPEILLPARIVESAMDHAVEHGLTFRNEEAHQGPHSIHVLEPNRSDRVVGPATTVREVDWVARVRTTIDPGDGRTCRMARGGELPLELETQTVTVFDRRTGQQLRERSFTASPSSRCPTWAFNGRAIVTPIGEVDAWLTNPDS